MSRFAERTPSRFPVPPLLGALFALGAASTLSAPAGAQELSDGGTMAFGVDRVMGIFWERQTTEDDAGSVSLRTRSIGILALNGASGAAIPRLAGEYLLRDRLSVGGQFLYLHRAQSEVQSLNNNSSDQTSRLGSTSVFAVHPRAGYLLHLGGDFSLWPHIGLMLAQEGVEVVTDINNDGSEVTASVDSTSLNLTLDAMFVVTPIKHFYLTGGPFWDAALWGNRKLRQGAGADTDLDYWLTAFGLSFGLGGYF